MEISPAVVRAMTLELLDDSGSGTPLEAELRYDTRDPYAVVAHFRAGDTLVRWVFSRDLLAEGLYEPVGDGDVHVWPHLDARGSAVVIVELSSPHGEALLQVRSNEVSEFLALTREIVPVGHEGHHLDLDGVVARLLAGTADAA
jgi:hypothetical protein